MRCHLPLYHWGDDDVKLELAKLRKENAALKKRVAEAAAPNTPKSATKKKLLPPCGQRRCGTQLPKGWSSLARSEGSALDGRVLMTRVTGTVWALKGASVSVYVIAGYDSIVLSFVPKTGLVTAKVRTYLAATGSTDIEATVAAIAESYKRE
jgi:hypothetical protein